MVLHSKGIKIHTCLIKPPWVDEYRINIGVYARLMVQTGFFGPCFGNTVMMGCIKLHYSGSRRS